MNKRVWCRFAASALFAIGLAISLPFSLKASHAAAKVPPCANNEERRNDMSCSVLTNGNVEFAGYKIGESYHNMTNGGRTIYVDVIQSYSYQVALEPPYHGLKTMDLCLSPTSHSLMNMRASRIDFKDRHDMMKDGLSMLDDLGKHLGMTLSGFEFTAPNWPYWPSRKIGMWGGSLPRLFKVDESLWPTAKTIFATSNTRVGTCSVQVKLGVVDYDEYTMSLSIDSGLMAEISEQEFATTFRAKHKGMTFNEWNADRMYRNSPAFKINEQRKPFTNRLDIANWTLDAFVDTTRYGRRFHREQVIGGWCAWERLPEPFLGVYPYVDVALDESNRVSNIALRTDRVKDASKALRWFQATKEFLVSQGMDDCYDEVVCSAEEIELFINPPSCNDRWRKNLCKLYWIDKSKTLNFAVDLEVQMQEDVVVYFVVRRLKSGLEHTWRQCMEETIRRQNGQHLPTGREMIMRDIERLKDLGRQRKAMKDAQKAKQPQP